MKGEMYVAPIKTEYNRNDLFLPHIQMSAKRVFEYILNQEPLVTFENCLTGILSFDGSVEGDVFTRTGHKNFQIACDNFYCCEGEDGQVENRPLNDIMIFEWQHSVGDFSKIINGGLVKVISDIKLSEQQHQNDKKALEFLKTQLDFCNVLIKWAEKCSNKAAEVAKKTTNEEYKNNLLNLASALKKVPENPAESFYEAVVCLHLCFAFIPDSIGLLDRYMYPYYKKDIERGILTEEKAKEYLQELFLSLQAKTPIWSSNFTRGGESHFCIGGYTEDGEDGFNPLSKLIVEALTELPTYIPQISLRWTKKTPHEVLRFMMDKERKDPNKRIAFVNDEPRIKGFMKYSGLSFKEASEYSMAGCNEPALPGGMIKGIDMGNAVHSIENTFFKRGADIESAKNFEEFYAVFEEELFKDLNEMEKIAQGFETLRARDCNIVSNIFFEGCIKNAKSITQGGLSKQSAVAVLIGNTTVIDSLTVIKQFVFDQKIVSMKDMIKALENNWNGYEDLRETILKKAEFFGNDTPVSNAMAQKYFGSFDKWNEQENFLGKKYIFGNLVGYNAHQKFFGKLLKATPDGRYAGGMITFGAGQTEGREREGLSALLASVAKSDPYSITVGPSVTNVLLDEQLVKNDDNFEKLVYLFETYFKMGGTHFQLTYVSKEDLINAKKSPDKYKNLRVLRCK